MPETGDTLTIDGLQYEVVGQVTFTEGAGDSSTTWIFYGLRRASDGAQLYLELDSDPKFTLYQQLEDSVSAPLLEEADLERTLTSVSDEAFHKFSDEDTKLVWGRVDAPFKAAPEPFTNTRQLMLYRGTNEQYPLAAFYGQTIIHEHEETYYSVNWPAKQMERYPIEEAKVPTSLLPLNYAAALAVGMAAMVPLAAPDLGFSFVADWFMWIGFAAWVATIVGRTTSFYVGAHIVSSSYLLWFCTRIVDNYWMTQAEQDAPGLMAGRIGGLILVMAVIRLGSRRAYYMLADGAKWGGGISFGCYVCGLLFASMMEEYWYGRHFSWYVGDSPWGYIWPPILLIAIAAKIHDYLHVPMNHADFVRQIEQLRTACKGGPSGVQGRSAELNVVADDLGDATNIADDPAIARLHNYNETFFLIAKVVGALGTADVDDLDLPRLEEDLMVLHDDLGDLVTPQGKGFASIRVSPQVRALI